VIVHEKIRLVKTLLNILSHGFLWLLAIMPYKWAVAVGYALAAVVPTFAKSRVKVINANLKACFPSLTVLARQSIAHQHWRLLGRSFAERGRLWLGSEKSITDLCQ